MVNFNQATWESGLHERLMLGLMAKFNQLDKCKQALKDSADRRIGEATSDTVSGISMTLKHERLLDPLAGPPLAT